MSYSLIITEKPAAAKKIAEALADKKPKAEKKGKVTFYKIERDGHEMVVACAAGHLYNLQGVTEDKDGKKVKAKFTYPVMEVQWKPSYEVSKDAAFTKQFLTTIKKLGKEADNFIVATDYDVEGELIGLNVLRFACKAKDAARMKYSTLTKEDLTKSYEGRAKTLDWNLAKAGETRHILDWLYGINLSRALTLAIKNAGRFHVLSSGRVQGPALKIVVDREKEIKAFKPEPFWEIHLSLKRDNAKKEELSAQHVEGKIWEEAQAKALHKKSTKKNATVSEITSREKQFPAPFPFDLTTLQVESNKCFRIKPKDTLAAAQSLYLGGYISYPRTSSQKLPASIGYAGILKQLAKHPEYGNLADELLALKTLTPSEGKKEDSAHPAIYPTGTQPKKLTNWQAKVYDLIVKRFLATFAEPSTRESMSVKINCGGETFRAHGSHTTKPGWQKFYDPYVLTKDNQLPSLTEGQVLDVLKNDLLAKETQPPNRYSQASLVQELSKRNLGTKATRAAIVDHLFQRDYLYQDSIHATTLAMTVVDTLLEHCPAILDEELTRKFEEKMEAIEAGRTDEAHALAEARKILDKILKDFKDNEGKIGKKLLGASQKSWEETHEIGPCKKCDGKLILKRGRFGMFIACNKYPDCKATFSLPGGGLVKPTERSCKDCDYPRVKIIKKGKRPQEVCINKECPSKAVSKKVEAAIEHAHKKCEKCGKEMVLRKSIYGEFLGCSGYPKCRNTIRLDQLPETKAAGGITPPAKSKGSKGKKGTGKGKKSADKKK